MQTNYNGVEQPGASSRKDIPNVPLPSADSPLVLPGQPNLSNQPSLIPLFQYISTVYREYIENNVNVGYLKAAATTAGGGIPVTDAKITISKPLGDDIYISRIIFTDALGQTQQVPLPTRNIELSQTPDHPVPYTIWNITAEKPGYNTIVAYDVPIFPGVVTTQVFNMKPVSGETQVEEIYATAGKWRRPFKTEI